MIKYEKKYRIMKKWFKNSFIDNSFELPVFAQTTYPMYSIFTSNWSEKIKRETFKSQKWYDKYHY